MLKVEIVELKERLIRRGQRQKVEQAVKNWGHDEEFLKGLLEQILIQCNKEDFLKL